ncbi:MAG: hypothetical protein M1814_004973 [Vezdaea aestivalis]|nr:MAG: hypothetical protein M1814_004973 [Vezdaea aestivalis]
MYLPRSLISHLYLHLLQTHHPLSPPVVILVALEPDALCACRILTSLLKRDYIPHKIQPVSGYADLANVGQNVIQPMRLTDGGQGGIVICLGVGGLVDLGAILGLEAKAEEEDPFSGVEIWLIDARRPWYLGNVFGTRSPASDGQSTAGIESGEIRPHYRPSRGGIIVFDDGDIEEELASERVAYCALEAMPNVEDNGEDLDSSDDESSSPSRQSKKRKSWFDGEDDAASDSDSGRPHQRRRSNSSSSIPTTPTRPARRGLISTGAPQPFVASSPTSSPLPLLPTDSPRNLRRRLLRLRRRHEAVLTKYYDLGSSYSEPISSLLYSLASELGREDNDLLWHAIVGVTSLEQYGRSPSGVSIAQTASHHSNAPTGWGGTRGLRIRQLLRDEVRRLNPPSQVDSERTTFSSDVIPTTAQSPTDCAIRLSPEPQFLLIRHWSLYDSMLHSPYLSSRLHIWSEAGRKRLHKLLAKMGVSLTQCKQTYTHMDMDLKRGLRSKLLTFAPMYGLEGVVPAEATARSGKEGWGFVRSWGWKACLSAADIGVVVGAILEVGKSGIANIDNVYTEANGGGEPKTVSDEAGTKEGEEWTARFWEAYDALQSIDDLKAALPTAMYLHRAILRTGTSLLAKKQIKHLNAFRMAVVRDGPDVALFTHPSALTKLALWVGEAVAEQEREARGRLGRGGKGTPLVVAALNEGRGVWVVVGTGGGGGGVVKSKEAIAEREKKKKAKEEQKAEKEKKRLEEGEDEEGSEESESESEDDDGDEDGSTKRGSGRNKFGNAFQEVVDETNARVRIDSFENCVVEVKMEDLAAFMEALSMKAVVG